MRIINPRACAYSGAINSRPAARGDEGRRAERRVGDDHRRAFTLAPHLQAQKVAATGQVGYRMRFDKIAPLPVNQSREGDEVERAVRRD